jgi:outer membrane protein assembly factor BamB
MFGNGPARTGLYIDRAFTKSALLVIADGGGLRPDPGYNAPLEGDVYSTPVFAEGGVNGQDAVFVATEENNVYAFDTVTGAALWTTSVGPEAHLSQLGCGNINPIGVTSPLALDLARHQLYLDAMNDLPDGGAPPFHRVIALDMDTGAEVWSIELDTILPDFTAVYQNNRAGLLIMDDTVFVPFGGHAGDCGNYHGRVVAVPLSNPVPSAVYEFSTVAYAGAIWAPNGIASDGTSIYAVTGNAQSAPGVDTAPATWAQSQGEAVLRLPPQTLAFSGLSTDYFVPNDWADLDDSDGDLSSNGVLLFDLPGAGSGQLAFLIGKTRIGWLLDRQNLGGLNTPNMPLAQLPNVATTDASGGMVAYTTPTGTYVGYNAPCWVSGSALGVLRVKPGSPPTLSQAFCVNEGADRDDWGGSPMVTTTDGTHDAVIWGLGAGGGDNQLHAYDGDTGARVVASSGIGSVTHWVAPIVAKGTIYVAGNNQLYALRVKDP